MSCKSLSVRSSRGYMGDYCACWNANHLSNAFLAEQSISLVASLFLVSSINKVEKAYHDSESAIRLLVSSADALLLSHSSRLSYRPLDSCQPPAATASVGWWYPSDHLTRTQSSSTSLTLATLVNNINFCRHHSTLLNIWCFFRQRLPRSAYPSKITEIFTVRPILPSDEQYCV